MNLKDKHILLLPKWYPSPQYASAGIFVQRHIRSILSKTNISVLYVESNPDIKGWKIKDEFNVEKGIDTFRYSFAKSITGLSFIDIFLKFILYYRCLSKGFKKVEKQKTKIDLIHVTVLLRTGLFAWFKYKFKKIPYIITEHWTGYLALTNDYKNSWYRKLITPTIARNAQLISPASHDLGEAMKNHGFKNKYFTIHNVVDTEFFKPNYTSLKLPIKILTVAMILDKHKNISGMLNALKRVKNAGFNFEYNIVGKGEDLNSLQEYSKELSLDDCVFFHGLQPANQVAKFMNTSHFLLLFSNYENLPCVIVESLASGIPVIATDVGGISEMIQNDQLGSLIQPRDEEALYHKIIEFIENYKSFDKLYISEFAKQNFGQKHIGNQIEKMYKEVFNHL